MVEDITRRALVLSGGRGRGAYHVGVLACLEQLGWQPDMIVGTSIGAVNAVALGSGINVDGLRERWLDLDMLLSEIVWKDYRLLQAELQIGLYPKLEWIRFITPNEPLPLGNMTIYSRQNHISLFEMGEHDTRDVLAHYL